MKTTFEYLCPVLPSLDVERDVKWYTEKLGFTLGYNSTHYEEGPMNYAVLGRQNLFLHLQMQFPEDMKETQKASIRFQVKNIMPLYEEYKKAGVVNSIREETPWGTKEFGFYDLNGNAFHFYEDLK